MASSFTEYRGFGFWSWDPYIQRVAGEVADAILSTEGRDDWVAGLAADWKTKSEGYRGGCICLGLDGFLINEERRIELRGIVQLVTEKQGADNPLSRTGVLLLRLLDGQIAWTATSPLDYMVVADNRYLKKGSI